MVPGWLRAHGRQDRASNETRWDEPIAARGMRAVRGYFVRMSFWLRVMRSR
jgi:hypothetical protein